MNVTARRPAARLVAAPSSSTTTRRTLMLPLYAVVIYLGGTFLLFLSVGQINLVSDMPELIAFVCLTLVFFIAGYLVRINSYTQEVRREDPPVPSGWIAASAGYYVIYGAALLLAYGATGPGDILSAIRNPGSAYLAKFEVYDLQASSGVSNPVIQVMTLLAVLYTPLIPFLVLFWTRLNVVLKLVAVASGAIYASFFLYIGTLKGLGDLLVFLVAGYLIRTVWPNAKSSASSRRRLVALTMAGALTFVGYMAYNQSQRLQAVGIQSRFQPNPVVASILGDDLASGLAVVAFYPTHGYVGLAYNLGTPFEWSQGLGASRALNSYWTQYVGGEGANESSYPVRTEARTGWPADTYWSTIYPWLASDLTFPGTILFMCVLGWFYAQFWYEAAYHRSLLAVLMFCQLTLLVFYIPANNQIGIARTSLIAFVCLAVTYVSNRLTRPLTP